MCASVWNWSDGHSNCGQRSTNRQNREVPIVIGLFLFQPSQLTRLLHAFSIHTLSFTQSLFYSLSITVIHFWLYRIFSTFSYPPSTCLSLFSLLFCSDYILLQFSFLFAICFLVFLSLNLHTFPAWGALSFSLSVYKCLSLFSSSFSRLKSPSLQ